MNSYFRRKRERFIWLFFLTALLFSLLIHRLIKLQAQEHERFTQLAQYQHTGNMKINALRGTIYDRNGNCMAQSLALPSIAANPKEIQNMEQTAVVLSIALEKDKKEILSILNTPGTFTWVERKIQPQVAEKIEKMKLPGIFFIKEPSGKRFYPKKQIACHIVGFTGIDDQGLAGVEASYDELLSGKHGTLEAEMDERGRILPLGEVKFTPPEPGKDLYLTIDETVQFIVERELNAVCKDFKAKSGEVIIYDPKTGDVLAMANYPGFDPAHAGKATKEQLRNNSVCDSYEPGSTFKILTAAAALDSGKATMKDMFSSGASLEVGGYSLRNAADGLVSSGMEDIKGIITFSFNTGSASIGLRMGKDIFFNYLDKLELGLATGIDLPGETEGIMLPLKDWKPINVATISYGQGIAITPIQLVRALGALCNDGVLMKPRVVRKVTNPDGTLYRDTKPPLGKKVFNEKTCHDILLCLRNVCKEGTGKNANIQGYDVGGKTGTANLVRDGVYVSNKYIVSFIGVVPTDDPKLVMLVKIDEPEGTAWGGTVAAPLFSKIGSQVFWRLGVHPNEQVDLADLLKKEKKEGEEE